MHIRLLCTKASSSLKRVAEGLRAKGHKVYRTDTKRPNAKHFLYGDGKDKVYQHEFYAKTGIEQVPFTLEKATAEAWIAGGATVFARTLTKASNGKGIVVADTLEELVNAPLYTKYVKKKQEFRVHVFKNKVVSVVEKRKKKDFVGDRDVRIRNTVNGYVFCSDGVVEPDGIRGLALKARLVTNSDFVGVDIGYNEKLGKLFVIESNSCPGIEGSNVDKYVQEILNGL
jgi:ribosomal protein S17